MLHTEKASRFSTCNIEMLVRACGRGLQTQKESHIYVDCCLCSWSWYAWWSQEPISLVPRPSQIFNVIYKQKSFSRTVLVLQPVFFHMCVLHVTYHKQSWQFMITVTCDTCMWRKRVGEQEQFMMMSMDQPRTSLWKRAFLLAGFSVCNIEKLGGLGGELRAHESGTCLNNIMWNKVYGDRFFYFCFLLFFFSEAWVHGCSQPCPSGYSRR